MKVFVPNSMNLSRAMNRVERALQLNVPGHHMLVDNEDEADWVLLHAVGYDDIKELVDELKAKGKKYGLVQYCLRTTQRPSTKDWMPIWRDASIVWSYYDLFRLCRQDGEHMMNFNFYFAPMGVDPVVFTPEPITARRYGVLTSGYVDGPEAIREAVNATARAGMEHFHLGPDLNLGPHVIHQLGIKDRTLAEVYRSCHFVVSLRRVEGFELPAAEGLLCGARPVLFDQPHYRDWFYPWADFIPEASPEEVTEAIYTILKRGAHRVTAQERAAAAERFNWTRIARDFWRRVPNEPV